VVVAASHRIRFLWGIYNLFGIRSTGGEIFSGERIWRSTPICARLTNRHLSHSPNNFPQGCQMKSLLVALGAGIGAPARYVIDYYVKQKRRSLIPFETLGINILGSFLLGLVINSADNLVLLIGTGFAGAFTTWSTLSVEQHSLLKERHYSKAAIYLLATLILGIGAAALGVYLAK
jgi:CrcB protein